MVGFIAYSMSAFWVQHKKAKECDFETKILTFRKSDSALKEHDDHARGLCVISKSKF